jgi:putative DNA methylase
MASNKPVAIKSPRKLIEVALPLDKINAAAAREKSIRHGHPSTLHLWWARRPLAAARAVLFAQLVNDPGFERHLNRGVNKVEAAKERERLFKIIEDLVTWENTNNEEVLSAAKKEIWKSWQETCELNRNHPDAATLFDPSQLPAFHDPFAGGGAIPLEAQRLGLESYATDLNPVAVTINKAMIEIPPRFAGRVPVGPVPVGERDPNLSRPDWPGASGLAEDVRRYGTWMRAEAEERIGALYPRVHITSEMSLQRPDLVSHVGQELTVIAWLWARTVKSPNPAYSHVDVPLVSSYVLSSQQGKDTYVEPIVKGDHYHFRIRLGSPPANAEEGTKAPGRGANFRCILSDTPISGDYIKSEGQAGRLGTKLLAVVAEAGRSRCYLDPTREDELTAFAAKPEWRPSGDVPARLTGGTCVPYGLREWGDLFTARQLVALNTYSDLVGEARERCYKDSLASGISPDATPFDQGGSGSLAYSQAVSVYLALAVDKLADYGSTLVAWSPTRSQAKTTFARQALPMLWDFTEINVFAGAAGDIATSLAGIVKTISLAGPQPGHASQDNAQTQTVSLRKIISTDPPYFDNIGYADLSDFFYVWLRRALRGAFPSLFGTLVVPKADELVATAYRHGGKGPAEQFFLHGMSKTIQSLAIQAHPAFPVTIYYAFKQSDTDTVESVSSAGWTTFLTAVVSSGFAIVGTWPMSTERGQRSIGIGANALASSIILVCRQRDADANTISRREFLRELGAVLPDALVDMTRGGVNSPVAPVDLSQAIIGPGMGIFSKYKAVVEADGQPMSVRTALQLINRFLADDEFDGETQFCLQWLETYGWKAADYGSADTLSQAKGAVLAQMNREGILTSGGGEVQLIRWQDLNSEWFPERQNLTPIWQALHQLIANLQTHGEQSTGALLATMPAVSGRVRTLAYRLYTLAERKGLAEDARPYNELIGAWSAIELAAAEVGPIETQAELF